MTDSLLLRRRLMFSSLGSGPSPGGKNAYFTFRAIDNSTFKLSSSTVQYSINGGKTWQTLNANTNSPVIASGNEICWKATASSGLGTFSSSGKFDAFGNIMSLAAGDNFLTASSMGYEQFKALFKNNTNLVHASGIYFPDFTYTDCYDEMFWGCSSLVDAPILPALRVYGASYRSMFRDCVSLLAGPELPATTIYNNCYDSMFCGCNAMVTGPTILPATDLYTSCYYQMFRDCLNLLRAPDLPAYTLKNYCYNGMFPGCKKMTYIKCLAVNKSATKCTEWWLPHPYIAEVGTFVKAANTTWPTGDNGIPSGWIVVDAT